MPNEMENYILAIASFVLGVVASILVSRHFHRRSTTKRLAVEVKDASPVFDKVDSRLRETLNIRYGDTQVENLYQIRLSVTNKGDRPIRDCIRPLALTVPKNPPILEAFISNVKPEGREVNTEFDSSEDNTVIRFLFPLLNSGESFDCRLLFDGEVDMKALKMAITAEDLPPIIDISKPNENPQSLKRSDFVWVFIIGLLGVLSSASATFLMYNLANLPSFLAVLIPYIEPNISQWIVAVLTFVFAAFSGLFLASMVISLIEIASRSGLSFRRLVELIIRFS